MSSAHTREMAADGVRLTPEDLSSLRFTGRQMFRINHNRLAPLQRSTRITSPEEVGMPLVHACGRQ